MILDIFEPKRKYYIVKILEKLLQEGIAKFHDPTFDTLNEAIEYEVNYKSMSEKEATELIVSRNFCDLEIILEMEKLDLVELIEDNYTQVTYRLTASGKRLIRDIKLNEILR